MVNPGHGAPYALERYYHGAGKILGPDLGQSLSPQATMTLAADRIWLVTCDDEVLHPTEGLIEWFESHMLREKEDYFLGAPGRIIRCALYSKAPEKNASAR